MTETPVTIGIAIVLHHDSVLVGTRSDDADLGGYAEFPGGKCEPHETPEACAVRECLEETGMTVRVEGLLARKTHTYDHGTVDLHFYICRPRSAQPPAGGFRWMAVAKLPDLRFPPANAEVIAQIVDEA